jgi:DNA polymerase-3 subunit delta
MPEINYKALQNHLKEEQFAPVYLIYGEEFLYKTALEALLEAMIPVSSQSLNYEPLDGTHANIHEAIDRVNTFSMLSGKKIVAILDSRIFYSKQDENRLLEQARQAYDDRDMHRASKYLLSLLAVLNLTLDDLNKEKRTKTFNLDPEKFDDGEWLDTLVRHCKEINLEIPAGEDALGVLQKAIDKGFPEGNHLIITTELVDKRRGLFKTIKENGMIIDCSIPKGDRKADRMAQEAVLKERMKDILKQRNKTIDQDAYLSMYEMTGFDLRTFLNNLEKLVSYVGNRDNIKVADVESVLKRTKVDPIYALTNAIAARNTETALFYLNSLFVGTIHPLQVLTAITNLMRKILLIKGFVESSYGQAWQPDCSYARFQNRVMDDLQRYDAELLDLLKDWKNRGSPDIEAKTKRNHKRGPKRKSTPDTDLLLVKYPQNPYPIYQALKTSEKFTKDELIAGIEYLSEADLKLKSTAQNPKLILEQAIFFICHQRTGAARSREI